MEIQFAKAVPKGVPMVAASSPNVRKATAATDGTFDPLQHSALSSLNRQNAHARQVNAEHP